MSPLYYTYYESPIGIMQIGGTEHMIHEITFVDHKDHLIHGEPGVGEIMHICTEQLIEYFSGKRRVFDIPIVQEGTEFQQKVWGHLYEIDYGKTISYVDLAKKMGDANTTRAVANANAKNRIALINPCHRVIGSDKNLTGYAWGLWRKKWLLQHEFRVLHGIQTLF